MNNTTRAKILQRCFEAIAEKGFETLRTDKEIARLKITKGAFYHYFPNKLELGYAVIDEIILPMYLERWSSLEGRSNGVAAAVLAIIEKEKTQASDKSIAKGDVLANLMIEMSHADAQFREKLEHVLEAQVKILQKALLAGKAAGEIKSYMDARSMAYSMIGSLHGCYAIAKTRASRDVFTLMMSNLQRQLSDSVFEPAMA